MIPLLNQGQGEETWGSFQWPWVRIGNGSESISTRKKYREPDRGDDESAVLENDGGQTTNGSDCEEASETFDSEQPGSGSEHGLSGHALSNDKMISQLSFSLTIFEDCR